MGEDPFFGDYYFRPEKLERKWVKAILIAKIIETFIGWAQLYLPPDAGYPRYTTDA